MLKQYQVYFNRGLGVLLGRIDRKSVKPYSIHISVTHVCSHRCRHCDIWKIREDRQEMTSAQIKSIIFRLRKWLGPFNLNIAGGEPFIRKDMVDIIAYADSIGVALTVTSNGFFIDREMAQELAKAGLTGINISLDSLDEKKHDSLRGVPGTYKKAMDAIAYLRKLKIKVSLATIIMKPNLDELGRLAEFATINSLAGINFQPINQNFGASYNPTWFRDSEFWPDDPDKASAALDKLIALKRSGRRIHNTIRQLELMKRYFSNPLQHVDQPCYVGTRNFAVNEYGEVLLCYFMRPIGSVLRDSPQKIWKSMPAKRRRIQINGCKRNCNLLNCNFA